MITTEAVEKTKALIEAEFCRSVVVGNVLYHLDQLIKEAQNTYPPETVTHENRTYTLDEVEEAVFSALTGHITTEGNYALIKAFSELRNPTPKCPHCGQEVKPK